MAPGTRGPAGQLLDATMFSTPNFIDLIRHLDEILLRYGPDACTYFHRANIYRALGNLDEFLNDLANTIVVDQSFLTEYLHSDYFGDYRDSEIVVWVPLILLEKVHELRKRDRTVKAKDPTLVTSGTTTNQKRQSLDSSTVSDSII